MEEWNNDEIQAIMRYNWTRGLTSSECHVEMQPSTGLDCPNHDLITQRYKNFDEDIAEAARVSNLSSMPVDPLKINVEGQVAKQKQQIYFGLPIEADSEIESATLTKKRKKENVQSDQMMEYVDSSTAGLELEDSVYSVVKSESSIDIIHEIISSETVVKSENSIDTIHEIVPSETNSNMGDSNDESMKRDLGSDKEVKIEEIGRGLVLNDFQNHQQKQPTTAISPSKLCIQTATGKRFACKCCGKTYKNKNHVNRHMYYECQLMKTKNNNNRKKYLCQKCKRSFTSKYSLDRHKFFLHSGVISKASCGTCRQTFVNGRGLESHLKKKNCGGAPLYHFVCKVCNRKYRDGSSLKRHQLHECGKEPQYQCAHCAYCTLQKVNLIRHLARLHGSETENFLCPKCEKSYKNECTLKRHLNLECGREKLQLCNLCGYKAKRKSCLKSHMSSKHSTSI